MPRGNNQFIQERGISKAALRYDKNVGGVNYGVIDDMIQLFEAADIQNLEPDPIGAFRKRMGAADFWPCRFGTVDITWVEDQ